MSVENLNHPTAETARSIAESTNPMVLAIARAARQESTIAEAEQRLGVPDLAALLEGSEELAAAWERGRRIRRLAELSATPLHEDAVAERLGLTPDGFRAMLADDLTAREVWQDGRHAVFVAAKSAILAAAQRGEVYAVRAMERLLKTQDAQADAKQSDFGRLTMEQLTQATGISRQQLARWRNKHGLPTTQGGYYSMPAVFAWLRRAPVGKTRSYRQKPGAVQARLAKRIQQVITEELSRGSDVEPAGE